MGKEEMEQMFRTKIEELQAELAKSQAQLAEKTILLSDSNTELKENTRRLDTLVNNLNGVVYRCKNDRNWTIEYISDSIIELSGYPPEDFIANNVRSFKSIIHPNDREKLWEHWQKVLAMEQHFTHEYRIFNAAGEERWVWERGCGVFEGGQLVALEGFLTDITENKIASIDLNLKNELLQLTGKLAKVGAWEFDISTSEGAWAEEVARIHDMDPSLPVNVDLALSFYSSECRNIIEEATRNAIEKGQSYDLELEITTAKGINKWVRTQGFPVYEENRIVKLRGTFQDITIRKDANLKLQNEKTILKTLIQTIPDLIWLKDLNGVYIACNPRVEGIFALSENEIVGKTDYDLMSKEMADYYKQEDNEVIKANKSIAKFDWIPFADDGHREYLEIIKTPMFDSQGEIMGVLGIAHDRTEKHKHEKLLIEKDLLFQSLLDNSPVFIFFKDHNLKALHLSRNFEQMLGIPLDEIIGKDMNELLPSELAKKMIEEDKKIIEEGKLVQIEEELNGKFYTTIKFPIYRDGNTPWLAGFTIDITEQKKVQIDLIVAKEKAEESDKLKTAFLQNMSHEIRTPMNAIMGFSEILPDVFDDKQLLEQYTSIISRRCEDLLTIIDEILDIAKIESGHLTIHYEDCYLKQWMSEVNLFFLKYQQNIDKGHIALKFNCNFADDDIVKMDQGKIKQILTNLIGNAFKFCDKGEIELGCALRNKQLHFYVSDTGSGIPFDKQKVIFERFTQAGSQNSKLYGGTGLGLAIVKGILETLHGDIRLESTPGQKTTFRFWIPIDIC